MLNQQKDKKSGYKFRLKNFLRRSRFFKSVFFILLALFFAGGYVISSKLKTKGFNGLFDFLSTLSTNYLLGLKANPENIFIEIKDKDFKLLAKDRATALERGVIINELDGDYVPATLDYKGKKINVKLRLKGHMTDHLQDDKWSFRVKVKNDGTFMGMRRFSLQHPGTRGYVYEWIYHELMKREDIIALRYKFINVSVNGDDWGIYAVEENFGEELIKNNGRPKGPIIRFNPDLYWVDRYNELVGLKPLAEYASYYSANVECYDENKALNDSVQKEYYLKAIALMEGLREKKLQVDEVFDIARLARFHAIIDLVGGQHSIDWSDIKYYYNPVSERLEPVAYESFTEFPFKDISGNYRYVEVDSNRNYEDLHSAIFSDPKFFSAYVKDLEEISNPDYLNAFFYQVKEKLNSNLGILYKEFPYKKFDKQSYYDNQSMIRKIIASPKGLNAYFKNYDSGKVDLQIGAIESLPIEVLSISADDQICLPKNSIVLPAKQPNQFVKYKNYSFSLPAGGKWDDSFIKKLKIKYRILGASREQIALVFPFPHTASEFISADLKNKKGNLKDFPFLRIDETSKNVYIEPGTQVIDKDMIIPAGYKIFANSEVSLDIKNHSKIISYSAVNFIGTEDKPIIICSSDSTSDGIEFIDAPKSVFNYVTFKNLPAVHDLQWARSGVLTFYESPVSFNNCCFYKSKAVSAIDLIRSDFSFTNCLFHSMSNNALEIDFSNGTISYSVFENCSRNALVLSMSKVKFESGSINGVGENGLKLKTGSQVFGNNLKIMNSNCGISSEGLSNVTMKNLNIKESTFGLILSKGKGDNGYPTMKLNELILLNVKTNYIIEKRCSIILDGREIPSTFNNKQTGEKSGN